MSATHDLLEYEVKLMDLGLTTRVRWRPDDEMVQEIMGRYLSLQVRVPLPWLPWVFGSRRRRGRKKVGNEARRRCLKERMDKRRREV